MKYYPSEYAEDSPFFKAAEWVAEKKGIEAAEEYKNHFIFLSYDREDVEENLDDIIADIDTAILYEIETKQTAAEDAATYFNR